MSDVSGNILKRSIRMHEFMMTGGVLAGYDPETGRAIWTEDVDPQVTPVCPWHQPVRCLAWDEIRAGRGSGDVPSPTLAELRGQTSEELQDKTEQLMIARGQQQLDTQPKIFAPAPNAHSMDWYDQPGQSQHGHGQQQGRSYGSELRRRRAEEMRSRAAMNDELEFLNITKQIPDEIEIDGPEGEEGEE